MLIQEMSPQECRDLLARLGLGSLGCARNNQPYIIPIYFAYEPDRLYGFSTVGQKIEWMRANPLVCVEADEVVNHSDWASVIVLGRYEELPEKPEYTALRLHAESVLERRPCGGKRDTRHHKCATDRNPQLPFSTAFTSKTSAGTRPHRKRSSRPSLRCGARLNSTNERRCEFSSVALAGQRARVIAPVCAATYPSQSTRSVIPCQSDI
jgi:nitroimidazol reductase NimA-like FMN-containing flavoprotein (pyridoxamine 5'-phosphate oxidase superfamily)